MITNEVIKQLTQVKGLPPMLLRDLKKGCRIWGYRYKKGETTSYSLAALKASPINKMIKFVGTPGVMNQHATSEPACRGGYSGVNIHNYFRIKSAPKRYCVVGLGTKQEGVWMIDITDKFIDQIVKKGICSIGRSCIFETKGQTRVCNKCGRKQKAIQVVARKVELLWKDV